MKRILLLLSLIATSFNLNAQTPNEIVFDKFESADGYTVGNLGTDLTGATPGQNGWGTYVASGGSNADFQIVNMGGTQGQALQIFTSSSGTGAARYAYQDISTDWTNRTPGNDILEIKFSFFTGGISTSTGSMQMVVYNTDFEIIGGFNIELNSLVIKGLGRLIPPTVGTAGTYSFKFGPSNTDLSLTANTWYNFTFRYNKTTGAYTWVHSGGGTSQLFSGTYSAGVAGLDVQEVDFIGATASSNTVAGVGVFDDLNIKFTNATVLSNNSFVADNTVSFNVYPNPTKDLLNVTSDNTVINNVTITDLNGRIVKTVALDAVSSTQLNISDLSSGIYMMNITSDKGTATKKIVKN